MRSESFLMRFFRFFGQDSIAWSLRRIYVPVSKEDLVLEVGSGANPYFRANVLLDAYENTQERHWAPLVNDRPTVLGFVENLPFRDHSFDFIIASHVLEHSRNPDKFFAELVRVGKAGYIEVPHAFMERVTSYYDHRLEILIENNVLKIWKKKNWLSDPQLLEFLMNKPNEVFSRAFLSKKPFHVHVRFYWQKKINYKIMNPEINVDWESPQSHLGLANTHKIKGKLKGIVLRLIRFFFSQQIRNRKINLLELIRCPNCHQQSKMNFEDGNIFCPICLIRYRSEPSFIDFVQKVT